MNGIPDHLREGLNLLFVGYNPSLRSAETGHHYANPNNRFWRIIHEAGITGRRYRADEDGKLLECGIGFTNIVARPTKTAAEITKEEYQRGAEILLEKLRKYKPKAACYVGKGVYQELIRGSAAAGHSASRSYEWGEQNESVVPGVIDFVAPSSSGLVRMPLPEIISIYKQLQKLI